MNTLANESIALLRRMIAVPSTSFEEEQVCSLISNQLTEWGIEHKVYGNNIVMFNKLYDANLPTLALDAHIDTVPAAASYTRNPFDSGEDENVIYGLGSNDDGGSVVALIAVFWHFYEEKLPFNLCLTLTSEEERSGPNGARWIYGKEGPFAEKLPEWTIIGEPTGMRAATSERGLLVIDGEAVGVSGHAARNEGVNALYIAMDDIQKLRNYRFSKVSPTMGEVKLSVTQVNAGTAHNVVPDKCTFVIDIRPTEQYDNEEILNELQSMCRSTLKARNLTNRSSATHVDSPLLKATEALGIETFSSPTTSNWMRINSDAIKMGPGESSRSHHADEYILRSEIETAIEKYIEYINKLSDYRLLVVG